MTALHPVRALDPALRFLALGLFLALSVSAFSQTETATLTGTITDSSGATVVDASVNVTNVETGVTIKTASNRSGLYVVPNLPPGHYRVIVEKPGFKQMALTDLTLNVQDIVGRNFQMQVGTVSESITVSGEGLNVNTTDASVSTVIDQSYVQNMPLNGRSFQDLILLTPGVTYTGGNPGSTGEFSVNGQRTEENNYTLDGVSANTGATAGFNMLGGGFSGTVPALTTLGTTQALVSVDELQEFRIQSSTYSAEYGRTPGGQFAFETKSGTNLYHGTAYDYLRNNFFDAADWFDDYFGLPAAALRQNDFGGTFGGPVRIPHVYNGKDKTFFFVSSEGLRLTAPQPAVSTDVPDKALRSATAANSPVLGQALNAWSVPNGTFDDPANGIASFTGNWSNPSSIDSFALRLDHVINNKARIFFRFTNTDSSSATRSGGVNASSPSDNTILSATMRSYTAGITSLFSNRVSNEFRLNYTSNDTNRNDVIDSFGGAVPVQLGKLAGFPGSSPLLALEYGGFFVFLDELPLTGVQQQWNLVDGVSVALGRHQLKFGVDYRRLTPHATFGSPSLFYCFCTDAADVIANSEYGDFTQTFAPAYPRFKNFSAFAEDEWKVSQRLHLSLGLRWELNPPPGASQGLMPYTYQGAGPNTWAVAPQGTPLWKTTWFNFAPRIGAAYAIRDKAGWETVLRGGGGVFFDTGQQLGSQGFAGPGFTGFGEDLGVPFGGPVVSFPGTPTIIQPVNPPTGQYESGAFAAWYPYPHLQLPYTLQWNASVEQSLGKSQAVTLAYVGAHASRLLEQDAISAPSNPHIQEFFLVRNALTNDYNSFQAQYNRRLSRGLTALASYTWSHCMDWGSQNFSLSGYQRGNCDFDIRHNLSAAFSYDVPNVGHNGFANALLHHWGIDDRVTVRTALPVFLTGSPTFDPITGRQTSTGLDLVQGQPLYLYGANCDSVYSAISVANGGPSNTLPCPAGRAINPCAFVLPDGKTPYAPPGPCLGGNVVGLVPRNVARGFGAWQMNMSVRREFPIYEHLKLQFRAEVFNIFNHPNFANINTSFGNPLFGQFQGTLASSTGGLNSLYQTGGPRSMQFALKLIF